MACRTRAVSVAPSDYQAGDKGSGSHPAEAHAKPPVFGRLPDRIEGVWNARVNITVCETGAVITSFDAMAIFGSNGAFHDTNSLNPMLSSEAFGKWTLVRKNRYRIAFRYFSFDPAGIHLGSRVVRHDVVMSKDGETYTSEGTAEFYDADGNLFMTGCSDAAANRFK